MRRSLPAALAASLMTLPLLLTGPALAQQAQPTPRTDGVPAQPLSTPPSLARARAATPTHTVPVAPSAAQARAQASMNATAPYTATPPTNRRGPNHNSQTVGGAQGPTFHALGVPVTIDAPVAAPYSNSWANNVAGQPGTGAQTTARGLGIPAH